MVAGQHRLEGLGLLPLGMVGRQRHQPVEREEALAVERLLDPGGAVLIEGGDPVPGRDEGGATLGGGRGHEVDERLLYRAVVPGRQRVLGPGAGGPEGNGSQCAKERAASGREPGEGCHIRTSSAGPAAAARTPPPEPKAGQATRDGGRRALLTKVVPPGAREAGAISCP